MALASYLFSVWRLTSLGGQVRTGDEVVSIRTAGGRVRGITLTSSETLDADLVIGAIHPRKIVGMLEPETLKPSYRRRIQALTDTRGMAVVHALVPADHHSAINHNFFVIQTDATGDTRDLVYVQLRPSERPDQTCSSGHEALWNRWQDTLSGRRGDEYLQTKMDFATA